MKQTLEEKQAEKQRLAKAYKAKQRQNWAELVEREPRLIPLRKAIRRATDPAALLVSLADSWVRFAAPDARYAVLRMIDTQAEKQSFRRLDDPLPPERNLYIAARELLAVR